VNDDGVLGDHVVELDPQLARQLELQDRLLSELVRVVRPGGLVIGSFR
jgi:hypothetical protein